MSDFKKDIVRRLTVFEQDRSGGYLCYIIMQGYRFYPEKNVTGCLVEEKLHVGYFKEEELDTIMKFVNGVTSNIVVHNYTGDLKP
jgi:hypothetical protein